MDILTAQLRARSAVARIVPQADVDDVLQIAALKAWRQRKQFRGESSYTTWFMRIAINEALYLARKPRRTCSLDAITECGVEFVDASTKTPEKLAMISERDERLYRAIEQLPPMLRAGAYDMLRGEMCSDPTLKARRFRARRKLKELLTHGA